MQSLVLYERAAVHLQPAMRFTLHERTFAFAEINSNLFSGINFARVLEITNGVVRA